MIISQKQIYISAMESNFEPRMSQSALELMIRLTEKGFRVQWEKEFRGYPVILSEIESSDALLAIADETWKSSTWMAIEISHALGLGSWGERINPNPIPTFYYPLSTRKVWIDYFIEQYPNRIAILDSDIDKAASQIKAKLSG